MMLHRISGLSDELGEIMDIAALNGCQRCDLHKTRTNILLGEGDLKAQIMFVAQAPGEIEDKDNRMFRGPSGQMLDKLFAAAGIIRNKVYITNLIKCHLPGNRRPKQREIKACSVFLEEEIRIIKPQIIVPLGYYATQYLFSRYSSRQLTRKEYPGLIGKVYPMQDLIIFPVSHPASLLYNHEFIAGNILNYQKLHDIIGE